MAKSKTKLPQSKPIWLIAFGFFCLILLVATLLKGTDIALLSPKGYIAGEQRRLMILSVIVLLEVGIPTLVLFYFIAWKYRESNTKATYSPHARYSKSVVAGIWGVPFLTMLFLASIMWPATHALAPQRSIDSNVKPLSIQVVAMRWKWLFIYPEQNIATINFVQLPVGTPVQFDLTADETPMSSFWIPHLGGQLYAMTGHVNRLNLMADTPGNYTGSTAEINGSGFAGMRFTARAGSAEDFDQWVADVRDSSVSLTSAEYKKLLIPSEYNKVTSYAQVQPGLYDNMLMKYMGSHTAHTEHETEHAE